MGEVHTSKVEKRRQVTSVAGWIGKIARKDKIIDGYLVRRGTVTVSCAEPSTSRAFPSPWPEWPDPSPGDSVEPFTLSPEDMVSLEQDSQATR